jgi:hypothetical protein
VPKALITEKQLIDAINVALRNDWKHQDHHCLVSGLRRVALSDRNWEVSMSNTGGADFRHAAECEALKERVIAELIPKYDVKW